MRIDHQRHGTEKVNNYWQAMREVLSQTNLKIGDLVL